MRNALAIATLLASYTLGHMHGRRQKQLTVPTADELARRIGTVRVPIPRKWDES